MKEFDLEERKTANLKNKVIILAGLIVSFAGFLYIVKHYQRMLLKLLCISDEESDDFCSTEIFERFKQL